VTELHEQVIAEARSWVGTPYRHQASLKGVGCDCLGLVRGVWRALYGGEPQPVRSYSPDWAEAGNNDALHDAARRHLAEKQRLEMGPGDVILFRWKPQLCAKHLGILVADDEFIHAYEGHCVMASPLVPQWRNRIAGVFSFKPPEG
jgi:NlpC/P60 family putative phage cell wall peptidase